MSMQGRYIEDDRLSALAEQSARLCRKAGPVPAKATVSKLRAAMSEIDAAYEKVAERFGTAASVPDACRWLLDTATSPCVRQSAHHWRFCGKSPCEARRPALSCSICAARSLMPVSAR